MSYSVWSVDCITYYKLYITYHILSVIYLYTMFYISCHIICYVRCHILAMCYIKYKGCAFMPLYG